MRQLGTLPDAPSARTLADYLLNLSIETRLEESAGGWIVWVCDEDRVPRAREEFQTFLKNPGDERYRQASQTAERRRAEEARSAAAARRPRSARSRRSATPHRRLTFGLIAASVFVTLLYHAPQERPLIFKYFFITELTYQDNKLSWRPKLPEVKRGEIWRLLTPVFIHLSAEHILFNMLALFVFGSVLERRYGPWKLALMVVVFGVVSNLCQYLFSAVTLEDWALVVKESNPYFGGMSGVIYGLFGFVWMKAVYDPGCGLTVTPGNILLMIGWLLLCMAGVVSGIANTAHLVGLVLGMVAGYGSAWWNGFGHIRPDAPE